MAFEPTPTKQATTAGGLNSWNTLVSSTFPSPSLASVQPKPESCLKDKGACSTTSSRDGIQLPLYSFSGIWEQPENTVTQQYKSELQGHRSTGRTACTDKASTRAPLPIKTQHYGQCALALTLLGEPRDNWYISYRPSKACCYRHRQQQGLCLSLFSPQNPYKMPNVQLILAGIAKLPEGSPLVVALVGATTGIGSYTAKAWAATFANHGSKLRVYIVGRNATRAEALLKYCRETSPGSDWQFIQATDLSLMSEVDSVSQRIIHQEELSPFLGGPARLDALYLSQAQSPVQKSSGTSPVLTTRLVFLDENLQ